MGSTPPPMRLPALARWQTMVLHGVIPIILVGAVLPIGLTAAFLAMQQEPLIGAIEHGELFLSAGNAGFVGCLVLLGSRTDAAVSVALASMCALILIMVPAFCFWAFLTVQSSLDKDYSEQFAIIVGGAYAVLASAVALVFVWLSYRPPLISQNE